MRDLSSGLISAGSADISTPIGKIELVNHPFMCGSPLNFDAFADMSGTGPRDGVELDTGSIIIIHATSGYKIITNPESTSDWEAAWTAYPTSGKPSNFQAIAVAASGAQIQVFARNTSTATVYVSTSYNYGASFSYWVEAGTPTLSNTYIAASARYNGVFIRHYSTSGGVAITGMVYEAGLDTWITYSTTTGLIDVYPTLSKIGVKQIDNVDYIFFSSVNPRVSWNNEGVMVMTFCGGSFSQPRYAIFYQSQEYAHYDMIRGLHNIGDRSALVVRSNRSSANAPKPILSVYDDFSGYSDRWIKIASFEPSESWDPDPDMSYDSTNVAEGDYGLQFDSLSGSYMTPSPTLDLSSDGRFGDDDYLVLSVYITDINYLNTFQIELGQGGGNDYFYQWDHGYANGWNNLYVKKSDFDTGGSPSWSNITRVGVTINTSLPITYDLCRLVMADPDAAAYPNPTGDEWNFQPQGGSWAIATDVDGYNAALACLDIQSNVEKSAVNHQVISTSMYTLSCAVLARDTGTLGVWFNAQDITAGSEDGYVFALVPGSNEARLYRYTAGTATLLDSASFTCTTDTVYYVGISRINATIICYASDDESDLFSTALIATSDDTYENGYAGVFSYNCFSRFTDFQLIVYESDESIIADSNAIAYLGGHHISDMVLADTYPPRDVTIGDRYSFDIDDADGIIYRSSTIVDGTDLTVTNDVLDMSVSYANDSSSTARVSVHNADARYSGYSVLSRGSGIRVSLGYMVDDAEEFANMGMFKINMVRDTFTADGLETKLDCIDANWLMKNWKSQAAHVIQSQNKIYLGFTSDDDMGYIVNVADGAEFTRVNNSIRNESASEAIVLIGDRFYGAAVDARFYVPNNAIARGGIILASDNEAQNCYLVQMDWEVNTVAIYKITNGVPSLLTSQAVTLSKGVGQILRVLHRNNTIYVYTGTSVSPSTMAYRTSYTDNSTPYLFGNVGLEGYVLGSSRYIAVQSVQVVSLVKDVTVFDAISEIATKAGVLDHVPQYRFYDDFPGTTIDSDKWDSEGSSLDSIMVIGGSLRIEQTGSAGYMISSLYGKDMVVEFLIKFAESEKTSIVYRMNDALTDGFRMSISSGDSENSTVEVHTVTSGTERLIYRNHPRTIITWGEWLKFRLSVDGEWASLWLGETWLGTVRSTYRSETNGYFGVGADNVGEASLFDEIQSYYCWNLVDSLAVNVGDDAEKLCKGLANSNSARYYIEEDAEIKVGSMSPPAGSADVFGTSDPLVLEDQIFEAEVTEDDQDWVTHVRVVGKGDVSIDYYDRTSAGLDALGYRFDIVKAEDLVTNEEMINLAEATVHERNSGVSQHRLGGQSQLAIQRGDRVTVRIYNIPGDADSDYRVNGDFVVKSISDVSFSRKPGPSTSMTLEVGKT